MIDVGYLFAGQSSGSTPLRYGRRSSRPDAFALHGTAADRRPVVVWNVTRRCNLFCVHCYSDSTSQKYPGELETSEARSLIADLAGFKIPALLLSGGEPLMRPDLFELAAFARERGLRVVLSTNGTLIDDAAARRVRDWGFSYVGISLDGLRQVNDAFRGRDGAFDRALAAIRRLRDLGQKVGLRLTLTKETIAQLPSLLDLVEAERIPRVCFYHLVPAGRGGDLVSPNPVDVRAAVDKILDRSRQWAARGIAVEVLTVDNPCDGVHLLNRLRSEGSPRLEEVEGALAWNGGGRHGPGTGLGCVDARGNVHPDQFWHDAVLGNVRDRPFSEIWSDGSNPTLAALRGERRIEGRCATCRFSNLCGGGFRARAALATGNPNASDPGCYLTDEEIRA